MKEQIRKLWKAKTKIIKKTNTEREMFVRHIIDKELQLEKL